MDSLGFISSLIALTHHVIIWFLHSHVGDVFAAISPLVDFTWHEEVRNLCARILPKLFTLLVNGLRSNQTTAQQCLELYNESVKMLIEQYTAEDAATERSCIAESLRDIFCVAPKRCIES